MTDLIEAPTTTPVETPAIPETPVLKVLRDARDYLKDHHTKGEYITEAGDACALGGIAIAALGFEGAKVLFLRPDYDPNYSWEYKGWGPEIPAEAHAAANAVAEQLPFVVPGHSEVVRPSSGWDEDWIPSYNDSDVTTKEDVIDLFDRAIVKLELEAM